MSEITVQEDVPEIETTQILCEEESAMTEEKKDVDSATVPQIYPVLEDVCFTPSALSFEPVIIEEVQPVKKAVMEI